MADLHYFCNAYALPRSAAAHTATGETDRKNKHYMKISITRPLIAVAAAALLSSCMGEKFHVEGNVKNAKDSVLYFEHNGLEGFTVVDSVKLDETGTFAPLPASR